MCPVDIGLNSANRDIIRGITSQRGDFSGPDFLTCNCSFFAPDMEAIYRIVQGDSPWLLARLSFGNSCFVLFSPKGVRKIVSLKIQLYIWSCLCKIHSFHGVSKLGLIERKLSTGRMKKEPPFPPPPRGYIVSFGDKRSRKRTTNTSGNDYSSLVPFTKKWSQKKNNYHQWEGGDYSPSQLSL